MSAQLVTLTGTGEILIKYTESSVEKSITVSSPTTGLYLDDANTNFKYKVLSGSVTVSTSISPFDEVVTSYVELIWDITLPYGSSTYQIEELIIDTTTYTFSTPVIIKNPISLYSVANRIFNLNVPTLTCTSGKEQTTNVNIGGTSISTVKYNLILAIEDLVGDVFMKINNTATNASYLIKAISAAEAVPIGYQEFVNPCGVTLPPP